MYARIISERDFQTIHLKIITPKKALVMSNDLISYELFSGDLGPVSLKRVVNVWHCGARRFLFARVA